ncbi:hypothetical protein [Sedimentisphaera salicampi]|uniref:Uncharacterized protein n=1 Tax=Sedimentisphaera salicampi TaxID=1941349 RepID=A0A1W6LNJ3_9BACT|nr:hypothetical protein [Sedimentisphaera salicampi]ARN57355.1 hypothetical protein STSP1_01760 [Sedimentisphaera salicampi]
MPRQQQGIGKSNIYKTCPKTQPVGKTDQSENPTGTCPKTRPVGKSDQSENQAGTCPKTRQEPVRKLDHKRIRKEKSNVDEPSGYAFVLKGGKDYSLPKAKLEKHQKTFTAMWEKIPHPQRLTVGKTSKAVWEKRSQQRGRNSHTPNV